jgi:phosphomannomutase
MSIFKAYDIRGVYPSELNEDTAYKIGLAYSEMRKKEVPKKKTLQIVVGCDMRLSSPSLKKNLILGLIDGGLDVIDIGLAPTPTFYFAVAYYNYDGGILVSASHNPKEYNGFKIVRDRAIPVSKDSGMFTLRDLVDSNNLKKAEKKGKISIKNDVLINQIKKELAYANFKKIKPFTIVIDTANSMGALYFDELFKHLNCRIIRMNWVLDGSFPAHEADPFKYENVKSLCEKIVKENADLGISTDGDADRIFFFDNKGKPIEPGITRAIMCKIFLKENPGSKIAYDIRPGKITEDIILENGGIPVVTRVGHSLIKEAAIKEKAVFAGESSGHFFLNMKEGCYEVPIIVTLKLLIELSLNKIPFSEYIIPFKRYFHSGEINTRINYDPQKKLDEIKKKYKKGVLNEIDGITITFDDYWFNLRASNTEPLIRLTVEAKSQKLMESKRDEILAFVRA